MDLLLYVVLAGVVVYGLLRLWRYGRGQSPEQIRGKHRRQELNAMFEAIVAQLRKPPE